LFTDTRFSQQDLPGWSGQPGPWQVKIRCGGGRSGRKGTARERLLTPFFFLFLSLSLSLPKTALLLTAAAAALFALGGASLVASASVIEVSARYDLACAPGGPVADAAAGAAAWAAAGGGAPDNARPPCTLTLPPLPRPVRPGTPLFLYYALSSFHQNHRRYARSRWDAQLRGEVGGGAAASGPALDVACAPRARADPADPASSPTTPCGLVAWSTFNDTFQLSVLAPASSSPADASLAAPLPVAGTGIGVPGDGAARFGNGSVWASPGHNSDPATRGGRAAGRAGAFVVPLSEDEHLHVWMRPAALPSFRKLWGVVRVEGVGGLPAGAAVAIAIDNRCALFHPLFSCMSHTRASSLYSHEYLPSPPPP